MSGETQASLATVSTVLVHVQSGRLRALGVSSAKRSATMPDVPTIAEAGVPGYEMNPWIGGIRADGNVEGADRRTASTAEINRALEGSRT